MATRGVSIGGDLKKLEAKLLQLHRVNFQKAGREVGETLVSSTIQRFAEARAPDGTPWQPLSLASTYGSLSKRDYTKRGQIRKGDRKSVV